MSIPQTIANVAYAPQAETDRFLPEGPRRVHVLGHDAIAWVNVQTAADASSGHIHVSFLDTGERRRFALPARPGFLLPTDMPDTLVVGLEKAVGMLNLPRSLWTPFARLPDVNPRTIINDGEALPGGRGVLFGTKDDLFRKPLGHLYLMTLPDQQIIQLADGMTCSNGKIVLPMGADCLVYDIDTPRRKVERYYLDLTKKDLTPNGTAIDFRREPAFPDGMVYCGDGSAIVAFYHPHRGGDGLARRYRLDTGEEVEEWILPGSPRVTCPLLIELDGQVVVMFTTAVEGMSDELRRLSPNAGCLFIADLQVQAQATTELVRI